MNVTQIIEQASREFKINLHGHHGLPHWHRVHQRGLKLAQTTGANIKVVTCFAFLHDACRHNEHDDPQHGQRGAANALALNAFGNLGLNESEEKLLCEAIYDHSNGKLSTDPTIATCWDADRLDLWRVGMTPAARFLSTNAAKAMLKLEIAQQLQGA